MRIFTEPDARALTEMAIREGLIRTDEPCMICGAPQAKTDGGYAYVVRHHPDIVHHPLRTLPICRPHHQQIHRGQIPDPGLKVQRPLKPRAVRKSRAAVQAGA